MEALVVLGSQQLLKLSRRLLQSFKPLSRLRLLLKDQLVRNSLLLMLGSDLFEGLVDLILGNLLHDV